jgi:tRNA G37 N-methylase Trm5
LLDLNPASYASLVRNAARNGCDIKGEASDTKKRQRPGKVHGQATQSSKFVASNMDGRDFIIDLVEHGVIPDEVIMNLPANATDFLDVFIGLHARFNAALTNGSAISATSNNHDGIATSSLPLPRIHVHGFSNAADPIADMTQR